MLSRSFVEMLRISRELIPEAVEIDALATGDEPLHVRPAKAEVPQQRVLENLFPWPDSGHGRINQDEAPDTIRMLHGEGEANHVPDVMGYEIDLPNAELVENSRDVLRLILFVEARLRLG